MTLIAKSGSPTGGSQQVDQAKYSVRQAFDGSNRLEYLGFAKVGSAEGDAVWQIREFTYDGSGNNTEINYADGDALFDNVWTDRASLSYS